MSPDRSSILVVIPALNEEEALPGVLEALTRQGLTRIRVVDNGSTDQTAAVAQQGGAEVVNEPRRGYGRACWTGTQNLPSEVRWILFCDADGSDDLDQLPVFFQAAAGVPFVIADRRARPEDRANLTMVQNFGNWLATSLIRAGWGVRFNDLGPLRLIRRDEYEALKMEDRGFGWTVEMQAKIAERGTAFSEIACACHPRRGGTSKISGTIKGSIAAGIIILSTLGRMFLRRPAVGWSLSVLAGVLVVLGAVLMEPHGDFRVVGTVPSFWIGAGVMGLGFLLTGLVAKMRWWWFWSVALAARGLLLPMFPGDDIWRYLWEGMIQWHGFSPYFHAPDAEILEPLRTDYWADINHRSIPAIYPPLAQLMFRGLSGIAESVLLFKSVFVMADLAVCGLLVRRFGCMAALIYAWNPLVIYNFAGGAHYDSLFLLPMVGAWLILDSPNQGDDHWNRPLSLYSAALLLGIGVGIKWVCAPLVALLCWQALRRHGWGTAIFAGLISMLPFFVGLLFVNESIEWRRLIPGSFAYYARSAEFLPRLVEAVWPASAMMNQLYLIPLAGLSAWIVLRCRRFDVAGQNFFTGLLIISPAVHIWYFTWLIPFAVATRNLGIRLVSLSAFVYFVLQQRSAAWQPGDANPWRLTVFEWCLLWLPLVCGFLWSILLPPRQPEVEAEPRDPAR